MGQPSGGREPGAWLHSPDRPDSFPPTSWLHTRTGQTVSPHLQQSLFVDELPVALPADSPAVMQAKQCVKALSSPAALVLLAGSTLAVSRRDPAVCTTGKIPTNNQHCTSAGQTPAAGHLWAARGRCAAPAAVDPVRPPGEQGMGFLGGQQHRDTHKELADGSAVRAAVRPCTQVKGRFCGPVLWAGFVGVAHAHQDKKNPAWVHMCVFGKGGDHSK